MGVSTTTNRVSYAGDGSSVSFPFSYYFFKQTDLAVYLYDTILGGVTTLLLNTDYTISGTPNLQGLYPSGANIVTSVAPASTAILIIVRIPPQQQTYALLQNGQISATALVQQMDYLTLLIQRLQDEISRCIRVPDGAGEPFDPTLPSITGLLASANSVIQINNQGTGVVLSQSQVGTIVVPYTALQSAGTTLHYPLFQLPATAVLTSLAIRHTTPFHGGSISDVLVNLGIVTDYTQFIDNFDIYQGAGDQIFDNVMLNYIGSWASLTQIYLTAISSGANLSALTQGSLIVYYAWQLL